MNEPLALFIGLLLRIGIPILVTVALVHLLSQLDARWQKEGPEQKASGRDAGLVPCWEQKNCPPERASICRAAISDQPCWQVFRESNGYLAQRCLDCEVFSSAPASVTG